VNRPGYCAAARLRRRGPLLAWLVLLLACAGHGHASVQAPSPQREAEARAKLDALRADIEALSAAQRALDGERNEVARELRASDQAIAEAAAALRDIEQRRAQQQQALDALQQQRGEVEHRFDAQREALAALLRSAHALGRHAPLKLLLAQRDATRIGRALAYQRYLQQDRLRTIQSLLQELAKLARLQQSIADANAGLVETHQAQQRALTAIEQQRAQHVEMLTELEARFSDGRARLAALGRDEAALRKLIESLRDVFADIPRQLAGGQPLAAQRGKLPRPVAGRVLAAFGGRLPDGRNSSGWLISAGAGTAVKAVGHGRVAFADWLKGYGLLLIVDHGDGFMSLYAANESLQKELGDWVASGETIASVGSSGGQPQPALYFELRKDGKPVDPQVWLGR